MHATQKVRTDFVVRVHKTGLRVQRWKGVDNGEEGEGRGRLRGG